MTAFADLADALERAARTRGRNDRVRLLGELLRGLAPEEIAPAVNLMLGRGAGIKSGVSWAALTTAARDAFGVDGPPVVKDGEDEYVDAGEYVRRLAARRQLPPSDGRGILDVSNAFRQIAGSKGRKERERLLADLLRGAPPDEAAWLARNATGEMRTGAQEGLLLEAIAYAAGRSGDEVRRGLIALGDVAELARVAIAEGAPLDQLGIQVGRPIPVMLADGADDLDDAVHQMNGRLALEWKLDGARVQVHKQGDRVWLWSRRMTEVTDRLPDVAALARREVRAESAILEGEVIVLDADGRPIPFQDVMRRWLRKTETESAAAEHPASVYLFDCLYADGRTLIDEPYTSRWEALERVHGAIPTMNRLVLDGVDAAPPEARQFYDTAVAAGHEGLMAKALESPYTPGRRGSLWLKVKELTTLDLVIVGADWGTGRRHRWLSNYHLGCRDESTGELLSVGETFKGLTDAEFKWMTDRLLPLITERRGGYVSVKPEVVVEVAFNGVQRSTRLPSGVALRFARITRIREDKRPSEADTLAAVRRLLP